MPGIVKESFGNAVMICILVIHPLQAIILHFIQSTIRYAHQNR